MFLRVAITTLSELLLYKLTCLLFKNIFTLHLRHHHKLSLYIYMYNIIEISIAHREKIIKKHRVARKKLQHCH